MVTPASTVMAPAAMSISLIARMRSSDSTTQGSDGYRSARQPRHTALRLDCNAVFIAVAKDLGHLSGIARICQRQNAGIRLRLHSIVAQVPLQIL